MLASAVRLAATSERYGLTPAETAQILRAEQAPLTQALAVIGHRCEFDDDAVLEAWAGAALEIPDITPTATIARTGITSIGGTDIGTADELLVLLPHPSHSRPTPALLELMVNGNELPELQMEASKP